MGVSSISLEGPALYPSCQVRASLLTIQTVVANIPQIFLCSHFMFGKYLLIF